MRTIEAARQDAAELAETLQRTLIPPDTADHRGAHASRAAYRPAGDGREVGGDFYDVFQVGDREWVVVIGDVTGKGVAAATVTAFVRHTDPRPRHAGRVIRPSCWRSSTGRCSRTRRTGSARWWSPGCCDEDGGLEGHRQRRRPPAADRPAFRRLGGRAGHPRIAGRRHRRADVRDLRAPAGRRRPAALHGRRHRGAARPRVLRAGGAAAARRCHRARPGRDHDGGRRGGARFPVRRRARRHRGPHAGPSDDRVRQRVRVPVWRSERSATTSTTPGRLVLHGDLDEGATVQLRSW